jgi:sucrose-6-phosphate hydrolase SacC (GH32 family)
MAVQDFPQNAGMDLEIHNRLKISRAGCEFLSVLLLLIAAAFAQAQPSTEVTAASTAWQPQLHFYAPPNWINDPNGPLFLNGQYHLFFQFNPAGDEWGHMSWGHAVSADLLHWKQLPLALPEENGVMIFSGSTVVDRDNSSGMCGDAGKKTPDCVVAIYTGHTQQKQTQNLAVSRDGAATWTKFSGNPVLDLGLNNFRDPKVFWHGASRSWVMVVSLPDQHKVRFYRSKNLRQWELASEFGPAGAISGVWECPDLMELPVRDQNGKRVGTHWVLNINLNPGGEAGGSGDQYFVGQFDGYRFTEDHPGSGPHWVDWGKDFYASTSFSNLPTGPKMDSDPIWIGWMSNWQYADKLPALPGRGEMTVVRGLYLRQPSGHDRVSESQESLSLVQELVSPLAARKTSQPLFGGAPSLTMAEANARLATLKPPGSVYVLRVTLQPGDAAEAGIRLRRSSANPNEAAAEETVVGIDLNAGQIFVDRTHSGRTDWSPAFPVRVTAPLKHAQDGSIPLEIVVDRNSIEVFAEDGETVFTNLIYPSESSQGLSFYATPTAPGSQSPRVRDVELLPLDKIPGAR